MSAQADHAPPRASIFYNPSFRGIVFQAVLLGLVVWAGYEFVTNARANLQAQRTATGFDFLHNTAGFMVNQSLIPYSESDTYGRVFLVGLLNTLLVSALGIVVATVLGFLIGIARLSSNWLVARLAGGYVELLRNLPLLFQILFWYLAVLATLPGPRQSIGIGLQPVIDGLGGLVKSAAAKLDALPLLAHMLDAFGALLSAVAGWLGPPGIYLNNRGIIVPSPRFEPGAELVGIALAVAVVASVAVWVWAARRQGATGQLFPRGWVVLALIAGLPLVVAMATGFPVRLERPELRGFNFAGGLRMLPEFAALLFALSTYTAAFIAEIVRAGVQAVSRGQTEAAYSLGLRRGPTLRLVVVPQAMRVIIPPLTSQYLNLTKNSSLGVAIGYPELFAVFAGTALNQTGQAIEIIAITMAVYLFISLITSGLMNLYNARVRLVER
jgi:general L-amino acid transport system permease protein